jgi:hypothetical protein
VVLPPGWVGRQLWAAVYAREAEGYAVTVSPDGRRIYLIGSVVRQGWFDYFTVAADAATGAELWSAPYDGPGHSTDYGLLVTVCLPMGRNQLELDRGHKTVSCSG